MKPTRDERSPRPQWALLHAVRHSGGKDGAGTFLSGRNVYGVWGVILRALLIEKGGD